MTTTLAIVIAFTLVWLLIHGRVLAAAALALLCLPGVLFAIRRSGR
jgi:hypothetical protein